MKSAIYLKNKFGSNNYKSDIKMFFEQGQTYLIQLLIN